MLTKLFIITIEYVSRGDNDAEIELDGLQQGSKGKRQTTRDVNDLIRLFPVCSTLDADLKQLHYELLMFEKSRMKEDLLNMYEKHELKKGKLWDVLSCLCLYFKKSNDKIKQK